MAIVRAEATLSTDASALPLAKYPHVIGWPECQFWGVDRDAGVGYPEFGVWTKPERDNVARYLAEAQEEIEVEIGYPLAARWITDEQRPYSFPLQSRWTHVIEGGIRGETLIEADSAVSHATDPATVTVATTVTDEDELHAYYPASLGVEGPVEISPSDIDIAGGVATISIPRCRLVTPAQADNPTGGLDYTNLANFLAVVDVYRVFNNPATHATLVWPHSCSGTTCACPDCDEYSQSGCIYVADGQIGRLHILPGAYSAGSWSSAAAQCCGDPDYVRLNYRAGLVTTTRTIENAIIRLAHSKMPKEPCGNERLRLIFERDQFIPDQVSRERFNCKFGMGNGAWHAWQFTMGAKLWRSSTL